MNEYCSRRTFIKYLSLGGLSLLGTGLVLQNISCKGQLSENGSTPTITTGTDSVYLPTEVGSVVPEKLNIGHKPSSMGSINIAGIGEYTFNPADIDTVRSDIFQPGHFSFFDVLAHLSVRGDITLKSHYDDTMATYKVDSINNEKDWWYAAHYSGGWRENIVFRMDMHPYKDNSYFSIYKEDPEHLARIYSTFQDEVNRLFANNGRIIIPEITIISPDNLWSFTEVEVMSHNIRRDVLKSGVTTALDVLLSLLEQEYLSQLRITWYQNIGAADPVDSYWVEKIDRSREATGSCGFVYETGAKTFSGFRGSHIHIPSDVRVTVSPEYAHWFWICL